MSGESLKGTLNYVRQQIEETAAAVGRSGREVQLVAASKMRPPKAIRSAYKYGQKVFSETDIHEWKAKAIELHDLNDLQWHISGPLHIDDIPDIVGKVALIHTVDSLALIREIEAYADEPQKILIHINGTENPDADGCSAELADYLIRQAVETEYVCPIGISATISRAMTDQDVRRWFAQMNTLRREVQESLQEDFPTIAAQFTELKIGDSRTLQDAITQGATIMEVGTAIFGARPTVIEENLPFEEPRTADMR